MPVTWADKRLELTHWAVVVHLGVATLLAVFFFALSRSLKLVEVRLWAKAWGSNTVALAAIGLAGFVVAEEPVRHLCIMVYLGGKTAFVLWTLAGVAQHLVPGKSTLAQARGGWFVVLWAVTLSLVTRDLATPLRAQSSVGGRGFLEATMWVWQHPRFPRSRRLAGALLIQGLLFSSSVAVLLPVVWLGQPPGAVLPLSAFLDSGAELLLGMCMLIAVESSSTNQLQHLHGELMVAFQRLRSLVSHDPLTGLANRRALDEEPLRQHHQNVAVIFFDVDNFKEINDRYGHVVGDACLVRAATAIALRFRSEDRGFRWGGDEFLVLAAGMDEASVQARFVQVARDLQQPQDGLPACHLSMGLSQLKPGAPLEEALAEADAAMYQQRQLRRLAGKPPWLDHRPA
ncbi:MAG: GGDEF domain-containing protein [Thermoanaerobaculum sp.]|nr:GGDEF domain-containing protein [Thermoanaerobaculum sp.]